MEFVMKRLITILICYLSIQGFCLSEWQKCPLPTVNNPITLLSTSDDFLCTSYLNKIIYSTDKGVNWYEAKTFPSSKLISSLDAYENTIIAGTVDSVFVSTNYGENWQYVELPSYVTGFKRRTSGIYAATNKGLYKSTNSGLNWTTVNKLFDTTKVSHFDIQGSLMTLTSSTATFLSNDDGATWKLAPTNKKNAYSDIAIFNNTIYGVCDKGLFWVKYEDTAWSEIQGLYGAYSNRMVFKDSVLWVGTNGNGCFMTKDFGVTWSQFKSAFGVLPITGLNLDNNGIYVSTDCGLFYSDNNGDTWKSVENPIFKPNLYSIYKYYNKFLSGSKYGLFSTSDEFNSWSKANNSFEHTNVSSVISLDSVLIAGTSKGIFRSIDSGYTWSPVLKGINRYNINSLNIVDWKAYADMSPQGFFVTENLGESWTRVLGEFGRVNSIIRVDDKLFTGSNKGVYVSNDYGVNWMVLDSSLSKINVNCLLYNGKSLLAGTNDSSLYVSDDFAKTWSRIKTDSGRITIRKMLQYRDNIFAATHKGIQLSKDNGKTWSFINPENYSVNIKDIIISNNKLFALSDTMIYKVNLSDFVEVDVEEILSLSTGLDIYPNPAENHITINGFCQKQSERITIYSLIGEKIIESDNYEKVDISRLMSGLYILKAGDKYAKFIKK